MSFEYIQIPIETTTSADKNLTVAFIQAFCDALADSLIKVSPSKSSPKKLVKRIKSSQMDTPTKIPTKPDQPELVESRTLEEKLALFPSLYGANPTGKKTSMTPFACHLLTNKETGPARSRRPRLEYPVEDSPVKQIPEHIAKAFYQRHEYETKLGS